MILSVENRDVSSQRQTLYETLTKFSPNENVNEINQGVESWQQTR